MPSDGSTLESFSSSEAARGRLLSWSVLWAMIATIAAALALGAYAYYSVFGMIVAYDDEGYMLIQIHDFFSGWPLYDDIVTLYGPMYFLCAKIWFTLLPIGHDTNRFLTIGSLGVSAILCGVCVLGLTRRASLAIFAGVLTGLRILPAFAAEPGHPQVVVAMLLAATAATIAWGNQRGPILMGGIVGLLVGALGMTKINIGGFAAISIFLAFVLVSDDRKWFARPLKALLTIMIIGLPIALIKSKLNTPQGLLQALFYMAPIAAVLMTALWESTKGARTEWNTIALLSYAAGGAVVTIGLCLFALQHGSTLMGLVNGIVLMPVRMAGAFGGGPRVRDSIPEALLSLSVAATYWLCARRGWEVPAFITALIKLVFAFTVIGAVVAGTLGRNVAFDRSGWGVSLAGWGLFLWIMLVRMPDTDGEVESDGVSGGLRPGRLGLALLAALQPLQTYPVAGSQARIGTMLMIPAAVVCLADVLVWVERRVRNRPPIRWLRACVSMAVLALIALVGLKATKQQSHYAGLAPLGLRESSRVRATERQVAAIRWLVANIERSCSTFLAPTGFNSLYLWANKEPASRVVIPNQVYMFSDAQQHVLLDSLEASPRPMVVYHDNYFTSPDEAKALPRNLLLEGMSTDFAPYGPGTVEGFTLRCKTGQPAPEMVEYAAWKSPGTGPSRTAEIHILPKPGRSLDRINIAVIGGMSIANSFVFPTPPDVIVADSAASSAANHVETFTETGEPVKWPLSLDVGQKLTIKFPVSAEISWERLVVARLLDRDGQWITSLPFVTAFPVSRIAFSGRQ